MKKKKILSMLLATVMVAGSLAGCGSSGDTQSTSTDTSTGSKTENTTGTEAASTQAAVEENLDYQIPGKQKVYSRKLKKLPM